MSKCVQIYLRKPPPNLPDYCYDADGQVRLELDVLQFDKTKQVEQLSEFDTLSGGGVLGFTLLDTACNYAVLKSYGNPNAFQFDHQICLDVIATEGYCTLRQNALQVLERTDDGWEAELIDGDGFWKTDMANMRMCDIDYPKIVFNDETIRDSWPNALYNDGDPGYYFPLVHYGNWGRESIRDDNGNITQLGFAEVTDFRPWFHVLALLQKAFCQIGWVFKSPVLESQWGRRLITYIAPNYDEIGVSTQLGWKVGWKGDTAVLGGGMNGNAPLFFHKEFLFNCDDTDPFYDDGGTGAAGFINTDTGQMDNLCGDYRIEIQMEIDPKFFDNPNQVISFAININGQITYSPQKTYDGTTTIFYHDFGIIKDLDGDSIIAGIGTQVQIFIEDDIIVSDNSFMKVTQTKFCLMADIEYDLSIFLDCEKSFLDWFKGILHLIGRGKIITDEINKCVTVYHPDDLTSMANGERPQPFHKPGPAKSTLGKIVCKSKNVTLNPEIENRFYQLQFADSDDCYVTETLNRDNDDNPMYVKRLDFGAGKNRNSETKKDVNNCFEPTGQIIADDLDAGNNPDTPHVEIPALWDNCDYENSTDIGPRIAYAAGLSRQYRGNDENGNPVYAQWSYRQPPFIFTEEELPFAYQLTEQEISDGVKFQGNVVYGNTEKDMYTLFWARRISEIKNAMPVTHEAVLSNCEFKAIDFRPKWMVEYEGQCYEAKLEEVDGFKSCSRAPGVLTFTPILYDEELECLEPIARGPLCNLSVTINIKDTTGPIRVVANAFGDTSQNMTFQWTKDGVPVNGFPDPNGHVLLINQGESGLYAVTVTNPETGCVATAEKDIQF